MRPHGWLLVALVLGSTAGLPAHAADEPKPVIVARDGTVALIASDREHDGGKQLCLEVRDPEWTFDSGGCGDLLPGVVAPATPQVDGVAYVGVAVAPATTSVEVRRLGEVVGTAGTVAGEAYRGALAGSLRFALVRVARDTRLTGLRVHARDAAGTLLAVLDAGGGRPIERRRLLAGQVGRVRWSMHEQRSSVLDATVYDIARETVERCVSYSIATTGPGGEEAQGFPGTSDCARGTPRDDLFFETDFVQARVQDRCEPDFRLMHGTVPASTRRVTVLLGDGRRRSAPTAVLRDAARRAWALTIAPADAVRSVTLESAVRQRRVVPQRLGPVAMICLLTDPIMGWTSSFRLGDGLPAVAPLGPVATLAGPPAFRVADGPADTLCLALANEPFTAARCEIVAPTHRRLLSAMDDAIDPHAVVFAVPADVATVRLFSAGGRIVVSIPTVAADGYGGRYAGAVRFAAATVSRWYDLSRTELLDRAGAVLFRKTERRFKPHEVESRLFKPRRVAGRIGGPSLWRTRNDSGRSTLHCLALTAGPPPSGDETCEAYEPNPTLMLEASCATRRLTVAVAVRAGIRVLAEIGTATPRRLRLRDGAGLLTLRSGRPLQALRLIGKGRTQRVRIDAPPGAAQCGWSETHVIGSR